MSTYAPDFLRIGVAGRTEGPGGDHVGVLSRRVGSAAVVAIVSAPEHGDLRPSALGSLNAALHACRSSDPRAVSQALRAAGSAAPPERYNLTVLAIDDASNTIATGEHDHALWLRRGPLLQSVSPGTLRYQPGDVLFVVDGRPFAEPSSGGIAVLGASASADGLARDFRLAALAAAPSASSSVGAVVAIKMLARDAVLFRRRLGAAVAISVAAHFLITNAFYWRSPGRDAQERALERAQAVSVVTISSTARKRHRSVPRPPAPPPRIAAKPVIVAAHQAQPVPAGRPLEPVAQPRAAAIRAPVRPLQRRPSIVVAQREEPDASRTASTAATSVQFSKAQLAAVQARLADATSSLQRTDPLSVPSQAPAAAKNYALDMQGAPGNLLRGQGFLRPIRQWEQDGYVYYYVSYEIVFSDGTYESGNVPWPIRYLPADDPFTKPPHQIPLPAPLPDYVLPPDTHLGRALRPYFPNRA
jgi:hypothetical protein